MEGSNNHTPLYKEESAPNAPFKAGTPLSVSDILQIRDTRTVVAVPLEAVGQPGKVAYIKKLTFFERAQATGLQGNIQVSDRGTVSMPAKNIDPLSDARLLFYAWVTDESGEKPMGDALRDQGHTNGRSVEAVIKSIAQLPSDLVRFLAEEARQISGIKTQTLEDEAGKF